MESFCFVLMFHGEFLFCAVSAAAYDLRQLIVGVYIVLGVYA